MKKRKKKRAIWTIRVNNQVKKVNNQYGIPTKEVNKTNKKTPLEKVHPTSLKPLWSPQR
jgi:hypothetical protein